MLLIVAQFSGVVKGITAFGNDTFSQSFCSHPQRNSTIRGKFDCSSNPCGIDCSIPAQSGYGFVIFDPYGHDLVPPKPWSLCAILEQLADLCIDADMRTVEFNKCQVARFDMRIVNHFETRGNKIEAYRLQFGPVRWLNFCLARRSRHAIPTAVDPGPIAASIKDCTSDVASINRQTAAAGERSPLCDPMFIHPCTWGTCGGSGGLAVKRPGAARSPGELEAGLSTACGFFGGLLGNGSNRSLRFTEAARL
jgi:hypothetical protein